VSVDYDEPGLHLRGLPDDPKERAVKIAEARTLQRELGPIGHHEFLRALGVYILEEKPLTDELQCYLGHALIDLGEGKTARQAFRMPSRGRPRDYSNYSRDLRITLDVTMKMRAGLSLEKAAYEVGEVYHVSNHTAEKAYKRHADEAKHYTDLNDFRKIIEFYETFTNPITRHWLDDPTVNNS